MISKFPQRMRDALTPRGPPMPNSLVVWLKFVSVRFTPRVGPQV